MFISTEEKLRISSELDLAAKQITALITVVAALERKVAQLEAKSSKVKKTKKVMTPEQKARQREYQRMYKARKKQEEDNWKLVQEIVTQGTTNVSS
jgi:DNA-binding transcriptional regulator PaaX